VRRAAVEHNPHVSSRRNQLGLAGGAVAWATPDSGMETSAGPMSRSDSAEPLGPRHQLGDGGPQAIAVIRAGAQCRVVGHLVLRHLLGERSVPGLERRQNDHEGLERLTRIRVRQTLECVLEQLLVEKGEHRVDHGLLGREIAAHGSDADAGAAGDLFHRRAQTALRQDIARGGENPFAIALRVGAALPIGDLGSHVPPHVTSPM
jgi:hypothetical protein